ncbi:alpha/beta fold hydrolase [Actinomadura sp. NAK00032]|uniref:alpha/beta fold hydrolase n=1 Tax=Actinomadura sp. NAK00032 TaxID=2742128 RepID=UPI001591305B|nr:alpha/beta fold hydrolase [Actinomadura sp. NAK00032]QKW38813.1 alpha/beta fold hydrolase [Actinomadura sp. NAK00032]
MWTAGRDGVRIAFEVVGRGDPLVLLHGFFGDRTTWRLGGHVEALAASHRLVLIDARGHGESDAPFDAGSYRIERQVDDVIAVLDSLEIDRAAMWGASMGGTIGLRLLGRHPSRLTKLIAGGAHALRASADPEEVARETEVLRTEGTAPFVGWLERQGVVPSWFRDLVKAADPHALAALTTALAEQEEVLDALALTSVPVLLVAGERDARIAAIRRTAAEIPGAELVELPGCGHLDAFVRTDLVLPVVQRFLCG